MKYSTCFNEVYFICNQKTFNSVKLGTCTHEDSIKLSDEPVLNKIRCSEMMSMYSRSFNTLK